MDRTVALWYAAKAAMEAVMTHRIGWVGAVAVLVLYVISGCRTEEPVSLRTLLEKEGVPSKGTDFGEGFDRSMAVLDELASQKQDVAVGIEAIFNRARAHLDLFIAALLSEDAALYEKLKTRMSWRLERPMTDPRNFQLLAQELLETFRLVARESAAPEEVRKASEALALYADGLQSILFRNKSRYFEGREAVAKFPELAYLDDLMAVRDLVHECNRRQEAPAGNWQNITLTVVGRVCQQPAARYLSQLCSTPAALADPSKDDYCTTDFSVFPEAMRKEAGKFLSAECSAQTAGFEAVTAYYDGAFKRLEQASQSLPVPVRDAVSRLSGEREKAYLGVKMLFDGTLPPAR